MSHCPATIIAHIITLLNLNQPAKVQKITTGKSQICFILLLPKLKCLKIAFILYINFVILFLKLNMLCNK